MRISLLLQSPGPGKVHPSSPEWPCETKPVECHPRPGTGRRGRVKKGVSLELGADPEKQVKTPEQGLLLLFRWSWLLCSLRDAINWKSFQQSPRPCPESQKGALHSQQGARKVGTRNTANAWAAKHTHSRSYSFCASELSWDNELRKGDLTTTHCPRGMIPLAFPLNLNLSSWV